MICVKRVKINVLLFGGAHVKKLWCLLAILTMTFVLTGCSDIDLTEEENRMIAEYAADLLLKYDSEYQESLLEDESDTEELTTEEVSSEEMTTEVTTEATTEEPTTQEPMTEEITTEEPSIELPEDDTSDISGEGSSESEDTPIPPSDTGSIVDIADMVGIADVSITYNRCMFLDRYPSLDQDGTFIYLEADPGYKLVVVKFDITNHSTHDATIDLLNTDIDYRLVLNGNKAAKPMLTILMDDLGTFSSAVPANSEQSAVLVFQMSDSLVDKIESLIIRVTYQDDEQIIHIQ